MKKRSAGNVILRGIIGIAPIAITIIFIVWLYKELETIFKKPIIEIIGPQYYFPGLGVIVAVVFLFFIGLLLNHWMIKKIYSVFDKLLRKIPFLKTIYSAAYDLMNFFNKEQQNADQRVVKIDIAGYETIGLVTRDTMEGIYKAEKDLVPSDSCVVFLPFAYQIGGLSVIVPKSKMTNLPHLSVEQALRFSVTAGTKR